MRIQFLVAAHQDPALVARVCDRLLTAPDAAVTVQWDCASGVPDLATKQDVRLLLTRAPCGWGSGAQLDAMIDSMRSLTGAAFDWLVVLSGRDYPVRPLAELDVLFTHTPHRLFVQTPHGGTVRPPEPGAAWTYLQDRYFYQYHWISQPWWSRLARGAQRVVGGGMKRAIGSGSRGRAVRVQQRPSGFSPGLGVRVHHHPFTDEQPCRKGSDWLALSRPVFDDLVARIDRSSALVQYFRGTYLPIESCIHTLLLPAWDVHNAGHNLHYVRFVEGRAHPEILDEHDWDAWVASGAFFARKFEPADSDLLDRIDRELLDWSR